MALWKRKHVNRSSNLLVIVVTNHNSADVISCNDYNTPQFSDHYQ